MMAQLGTQFGDPCPPAVERAGHRHAQPLGAVVQPLDAAFQQAMGVAQTPRQTIHPVAAFLDHAAGGPGQPALAVEHLRYQVGAHRYRHLGGGGRSRCPAVGREVDQGRVGLVADG